MVITNDNLHKAIAALRQCAKENENRQTDMGAVRVTDLCQDVAYYLERLARAHKKKYIVSISEEYMERLYMQSCAETMQQKQDMLKKVIGDISDWLRDNENRPITSYSFVGKDGREYKSWTIENFTDGTDFPTENIPMKGRLIVGLEV
jgi:hypothetical protein